MKKIYVAGHQGLVGSALVRHASQTQKYEIVSKTHSELDLTDREAVLEFFQSERPEWVFLAAAKVGGIHGNSTYPVDFLLTNLKIQNNVIESAYLTNTKQLLFLGSSCIYPKDCKQPIREEYLLSDYLEVTNKSYALAKISGIELCSAYNRQYGTSYFSVMPCNLYGINDNYDPVNGHALPMLLRRFHEAKENDLPEVLVWGTGKPYREYLFADDLADACYFLMENQQSLKVPDLINVGTGEDMKISDLVEKIKIVTGFQGEIVFDPGKPDGTYRKVLDVAKINKLGWKSSISLDNGLLQTYEDFTKMRCRMMTQ